MKIAKHLILPHLAIIFTSFTLIYSYQLFSDISKSTLVYCSDLMAPLNKNKSQLFEDYEKALDLCITFLQR
jgi:hypothetical protein